MSRPRIIIYAKPEEMILAARMASVIMQPEYQWPKDGLALFGYGDDPQLMFSARRNKTSITIYSQQPA